MILDDKHVKVENVMVLWDSVTKPEQGENGLRYKLKLGLQANNPAVGEVNQLATGCLNEGKWKGQFPPGAHWPITQVQPGQYLDLLPGGYVINPSTTRQVYIWDDNGNKIDPMQFPSYIYPGQIVHAIVHCWEYDNKQKGVATGLDGVQIQTGQGAPRQAFGDGGYDSAAVFGASTTPGAPNVIPPVAPPPGAPNVIPPVAPPPGAPNVIPPVAPPPGAPNVIPPVAPPPGAPNVIPPVAPPPGAPGPNTNWMPPQ